MLHTKKALSKSLIDLLSTDTLDRITVSDITDRCGVNRQTFYYYFKDINDLIKWTFSEMAEQAFSGKRSYATWKQTYRVMLEILIENKGFVINSYKSISRTDFEKALGEQVYLLTNKITVELAAKMKVSDENISFISRFYSYAFLGMTMEWILNGMTEPPADFAEKLDRVIKGDISAALERMRVDGPKYRYY